MRLTCLAAIAGLATTAAGQVTVNSYVALTGTIQPGGPRQGVNGDRFLNIEGLNNAAFASYGVARWDLTAARAALDTAFGAGAWQVTKVELELTQDNAAFSLTGPVNVYYSTDDTTDIKTLASPLFYPFKEAGTPDLVLGNGGNPILSYTYTAGATADLDRYTQAGGSHAGGPLNPAEALSLAADMVQDIKTQNTLTLVFEDGDIATAATYRGQESNPTGTPPRFPPQLFITAVAAGGGCYADCDHVGGLTGNDFQCFLDAYVSGASYADCDGVGGLTGNDFQCFLDKYVAGCS